MNSYFSLGDWAIIFLYLAGIILLGVWFGRDQHNTRDYFLGSKTVPWWGIGFSIVAAETSALTIIGVPAMAFGGNMGFLQMVIGYVIARILLAVVLVPHYFKGEIYSPYQLFADKFGPAARQASGGFFLLSETLAAGVRVYVASIPVKLLFGDRLLGAGTGDPLLGAIFLFVVLALLYTYVGGVKAVIWTDAVQFGLFLFGGIFALCFIPSRVQGGVSAVLTQALEAGKLHWLEVTPPAGTSVLTFLLGPPFNLWMGVIGGTVVVLSSHGAEQLIVQRVLACKSVGDGRKALVLSAVIIFPLFLIFLLVGAMLWVFYQGHPFQIPLPEPRPGLKATDFVFPVFIMTEVPHIMKGFLIVAVLSAAMSSVSSALTSLSSVSTMDFIRHALPSRSEGFFLRFSKVSTVFWATALILVAYCSRQAQFVLNAAFSLRGLTSGALVGGLALAVFWRQGHAGPVVAAMLVSLTAMTAIEVLPQWHVTRRFWMEKVGTEIFWPWYTLIGAIITLGTAWVARRWLPAAPEAEPQTHRDAENAIQ